MALKKSDKRFLTSLAAGVFVLGGALAHPDLGNAFNSAASAGQFILGSAVTVLSTGLGAFGGIKIADRISRRGGREGFASFPDAIVGLFLGATIGLTGGVAIAKMLNEPEKQPAGKVETQLLSSHMDKTPAKPAVHRPSV